MDRRLYPTNWDEIALEIKKSADWQCQQCGKKCRKSGESIHEFLRRKLGPDWLTGNWLEITQHPQRYTLTVAHLNHIPADCRPENLRALCAPCHCRMDLKAMGTKLQLKSERSGQLTVPGLEENPLQPTEQH